MHDGARHARCASTLVRAPHVLPLPPRATQCYRTEAPVRGCKEDLYVRRKFFYKRIGIERFVGALVSAHHAAAWCGHA